MHVTSTEISLASLGVAAVSVIATNITAAMGFRHQRALAHSNRLEELRKQGYTEIFVELDQKEREDHDLAPNPEALSDEDHDERARARARVRMCASPEVRKRYLEWTRARDARLGTLVVSRRGPDGERHADPDMVEARDQALRREKDARMALTMRMVTEVNPNTEPVLRRRWWRGSV